MMIRFNTDRMVYVMQMTGNDDRFEFPFLGMLIDEAKKQDEIGNGFFAFIEHTFENGEKERIPFVI